MATPKPTGRRSRVNGRLVPGTDTRPSAATRRAPTAAPAPNRAALQTKPALRPGFNAQIPVRTGLLARAGGLIGGALSAASNTEMLLYGADQLGGLLERTGIITPPKGSRSKAEIEQEKLKRQAQAQSKATAATPAKGSQRADGKFYTGSQYGWQTADTARAKGLLGSEIIGDGFRPSAAKPTASAAAPAVQPAALDQALSQYIPDAGTRGSLRYTLPSTPASPTGPAAPKPAYNAGMKNQDKNFKGSYSNTDDLKRMQAASLSRQQGRSNLTSEELKPKAAAQAEAPKVQAPKKENRKRLSARGRDEMLEENLRRALMAR